ncbi:MAG: hypothetical protein WDZ59_15065 [Pirellulales bacterium]
MSKSPRVFALVLGTVFAAALAQPVAAERFRAERIDDRIQNTACEVGPDGHLYVVSMNYHGRTGSPRLMRYVLDGRGRPTGEKQIVHDWGADSAAQPIGLAFDPKSTAENLVAWIALGESLQGHSGWSDPWAGRIYRFELPPAGSSQPARSELKITNLPHAFHTVNDIAFGPEGKLYICCGSTTTLGWEPHTTEKLLSGAILQADVARLDGVLDVKTSDGGQYNPFAPAAPLRLYGTAIRQPYDCTWHPNGRLYACTNQNDVNGQTGSGGGIPNVENIKPPEFLAIIEPGRTYGFPNAARGEFVLMGGNPTDGDDGWTEIVDYPVGIEPPDTFDPSLLHPIDDIGGGSADGMLAYRAPGELQHRLVACFYSANKIFTFTPGDDGRIVERDVLRGTDGQPLQIASPLDICEHPRRGHLYVAGYGKQDKGEQGGVHFLERLSDVPEEDRLQASPAVLVGEVLDGDDDWSSEFEVHLPGGDDTSYAIASDVDWLRVEPAEGTLSGEPQFKKHRVRLTRSLPPGTHYAALRIEPTGDSDREPVRMSVNLHVAPRGQAERFAVSAGNSREVVAESFPVRLPLAGTVISAVENVPVQTRWQLESGSEPHLVLTDPAALASEAIIDAPGRYTLNLIATRGQQSRQGTVTLAVDVPGNRSPGLRATADRQTVRLGESIELTAEASDDGLPADSVGLTYRWTREGTGSGIVTFEDATSAATSATFSRATEYRIRCTVSDGVRETHRDLLIEVKEAE